MLQLGLELGQYITPALTDAVVC